MGELAELIDKPETLWTITLIGAISVCGVVEFCKSWITNKAKIKWIVLIVSLIVAFLLSSLVPSLISTIVIGWLLILAVSIIGYKTIVDGLPAVISKMMGSIKTENKN